MQQVLTIHPLGQVLDEGQHNIVKHQDAKLYASGLHVITVDIHYSQIQIIIRVATTVGLVRGCSSTHVCTVNQMLLWSDVAFWQYSARNTSVQRWQLWDNFRQCLPYAPRSRARYLKVTIFFADINVFLFLRIGPNTQIFVPTNIKNMPYCSIAH